MKNTESFWNWQGNHLYWPSYSKWIAFAIAFIGLLLIFVFKKQIKQFNQNRKGKKSLFIFKDGDEMLRWFGVFMLAYTFAKIGIYEANDYPFKWEHLMLHICRIHFMIMMIFLVIKKKELIKYSTYISMMGAFFAIWFGQIDYGLNVAPNGTALTLKGQLLIDNDFTFYHQGWDNFFFYDFYFIHLFIILFPVYVWTANSYKITTVNLHRSQLIYIVGIVLIWVFNIISSYMPMEWWANNWYIGPDAHNDFNEAIGWFSGWPQNLPSYLIIGIATSMIFHMIWIGQSCLEFNFSKKFLSVKKNENWKLFTSAYNKKLLKNVFFIKDKKQINK